MPLWLTEYLTIGGAMVIEGLVIAAVVVVTLFVWWRLIKWVMKR